jgi:hypothetical protein
MEWETLFASLDKIAKVIVSIKQYPSTPSCMYIESLWQLRYN